MTVIEAGQTNLVVAYEDESLHEAAARMLKHNIGRLPVVERQNPRHVIGYLGRASILAAQARFYEEEEVRGRGPIIPSRKTLAGVSKR
jgi:CBS domain-containing protein